MKQSIKRKITGGRTAIRKIKRMGKIIKNIHRTKIFHVSRLKFGRFRPKIKIEIERGNFIIKTVENAKELEQVLNLRFEVFYQELLNKTAVITKDIDEFDFICDHLVIFDREKQKYAGTYRLNLSNFSKRFYSAQEFNISNILNLPGIKLELGRACVDKEYRTGVIISLLWRGLAEYIKLSGTNYLFGCSSVKTIDEKEVALLYLYLMNYFKAPDGFMVKPVKNFRIPSFGEYVRQIKLDDNSTSIAKSLIPPLLNFYLKSGAFVCGEPALDKVFKCVDFFTVLDMNNLKKSIEKKYDV
ncbi:MAG: GNAT family N-acetyltransferase [Candidatus Ratteibacteria bacterium]